MERTEIITNIYTYECIKNYSMSDKSIAFKKGHVYDFEERIDKKGFICWKDDDNYIHLMNQQDITEEFFTLIDKNEEGMLWWVA